LHSVWQSVGPVGMRGQAGCEVSVILVPPEHELTPPCSRIRRGLSEARFKQVFFVAVIALGAYISVRAGVF
ncbi:MAG: hypothetical protein VW405_03590, partial [Rhodospirillaceae bacterium]